MPLYIVRDDITTMRVDAIVNAANERLLENGGVGRAIFEAAGRKKMTEACEALGGCAVGNAKITPGFDLPCHYVIHAVGPRWTSDGNVHEELVACYQSSMKLACQYQCWSVAFPLISSGRYSCPKAEAMRVAVDTISGFLMEHEMDVYIVVFHRESYEVGKRLYGDINTYIDDSYVSQYYNELLKDLYDSISKLTPAEARKEKQEWRREMRLSTETLEDDSVEGATIQKAVSKENRLTWEDAILGKYESFSEMLLRKIDERGISDYACYKKANISPQLFSKIRSTQEYRPQKTTVIAFAMALEMSLEETNELLGKAGLVLSRAYTFDRIIEYFIQRKIYDVFHINVVLFDYHQKLLGSSMNTRANEDTDVIL